MSDTTRVSPAVAHDRLRAPLRFLGALLLVLLALNGYRCYERGRYEPPESGQTAEQARKRKHRGTDFTAYYSA
ncbi:MAG: hypothetical protein HY291_03510 [Planctomycetes bacterium]|nr:hypothetical protein [Planctomycetota bacterium]